MEREKLRALQAPLKQQYQADPASAMAELRAEGVVDFDVPGCRVTLPCNNGQEVVAGLHPKVGGDGTAACSGDMLLQALVTCAGTTLAAVATSMELPISTARIEAIGTLDFRGTLGVDRAAPVGFTKIQLLFHLDTSAAAEQVEKLLSLTERHCVVYQTLHKGVPMTSHRA